MNNDLNSKLNESVKHKKALIWDFDGVICFLNWNYGGNVDEWWDLFGNLYREFEKDAPFKTFEESSYPDENIDLLLTRYGRIAEERINKFFLEKEMLILPYSPANKQVLEIISSLDAAVENFIWSNNQKATIEKFLADNRMGGKFKTIISRGKEGYLSKPDIKAFSEIRKLTITPLNDFMFIGDSITTDKIVAEKLEIDFFRYK